MRIAEVAKLEVMGVVDEGFLEGKGREMVGRDSTRWTAEV